jgi:hypothetical protein
MIRVSDTKYLAVRSPVRRSWWQRVTAWRGVRAPSLPMEQSEQQEAAR